MALICLSLMPSEMLDSFARGHLCIFGEMSMYICPIFNQIVILLLLICMSSFYILDTSPYQTHNLQISSPVPLSLLLFCW